MKALSQFSHRHRFATAVIAIIAAIFLFDVQGAIIKHLAGRYTVLQIALFRNLLGMLPSLVALYLVVQWRSGGRSFRLEKWQLAIARGLLLVGAQICFYFALTRMELATATTLAFAGPLFVTSLSVPLLGHKVGLWRGLAVVGGFFGVVLVMRPGIGGFSWFVFLPVLAALFYATVSLTSRFFDESVPTGLINLYASGAAALVFAVITLVTGSWQSVPFGSDWFWLFAMGMAGGCAVLLMITAYRLTEPSSLSPFEYFGIPFSFVLGWLFFNEAPLDRLFPGVLFIVAGGLLVLWRERQLSRKSAEAGD